jgi:hypothetical protein
VSVSWGFVQQKFGGETHPGDEDDPEAVGLVLSRVFQQAMSDRQAAIGRAEHDDGFDHGFRVVVWISRETWTWFRCETYDTVGEREARGDEMMGRVGTGIGTGFLGRTGNLKAMARREESTIPGFVSRGASWRLLYIYGPGFVG